MRERETIQAALVTAEERGVLDVVAPELILEVLLDIRDMLAKWSDGFVIDRVPPGYGKEDELL